MYAFIRGRAGIRALYYEDHERYMMRTGDAAGTGMWCRYWVGWPAGHVKFRVDGASGGWTLRTCLEGRRPARRTHHQQQHQHGGAQLRGQRQRVQLQA